MGHITVLGIGNRLMMDDGIGLYVVENLKNKDMYHDLKYVIGETDIDFCLDEIQGSDYLIVVDAVSTGNKPGEITIKPLNEALPVFNAGLSAHNLHFMDILTRTVRDIKGILVGIEVSEVNYKIGLSEVLTQKLPEIADKVGNLIRATLKVS